MKSITALRIWGETSSARLCRGETTDGGDCAAPSRCCRECAAIGPSTAIRDIDDTNDPASLKLARELDAMLAFDPCQLS